jgi:redox-sensing transcriptional repressor
MNKRKVGKTINDVAVEHVSKLETLKEREIDLGIIAVPRSAAQEITDELVKVGIRGILNFSPQYVTVPRKVKVITIDIATDLACLPYYMPSS